MVLEILSKRLSHGSLRRYVAQAAPAAATAQTSLRKQEPKITTLPNGVVLASVENFSPVSRIAVVYKAGSRYETQENVGITHTLRYCAGLGTKDATVFGITRNLQQIGATLSASATREHMIYKLECLRDELDTGINFLSKITTEQVFKPWEIQDYLPRLKVELALMRAQPQIQLMELIHKAAFRSSLRNSLYCPQYMLGKHTSEMLKQYVKDHFTSRRMAIVGVGIPHSVLTAFAEIFQVEDGAGKPEIPPAYMGGEVRIESGIPYTHAAVVAEGVSSKDPKDVLSAAILQQIMGITPFIKRGTSPGKLTVAAAKATQDPYAVASININYSDSGLFGFYVVGQPNDMEALLKAVIGQFNAIGKSGVPDMDFRAAKHRVKAIVHMAKEDGGDLLEEMGLQAIITGKLLTDSELNKIIDSITAADVNNIAKKLLSGKPSMAAVGQLHKTPYLDQLR